MNMNSVVSHATVQVFQLESTFDLKRYLSSSERAQLAASLHLTETQARSQDMDNIMCQACQSIVVLQKVPSEGS